MDSFSARTLDGRTIRTAEFRGRVVLIDFWAISCGPCRADLPYLKKAYKDLHAAGLEVIGINQDRIPAPDLAAWVGRQSMPWRQVQDVEAPHSLKMRFAVSRLPTSILIDGDGKVVGTNLRGKQIMEILRERVLRRAPRS